MRILLIALALAASPSLALAQSMTGTNGTAQPTTTAPASNTRIESPKSKIPPAANTRNKGLRVGNDAMDAGPVEVKRNK